MKRIRLVHWNAEDAREGLRQLEELGYRVDHDPRPGPDLFKKLTADPPAAVVIDLTRLPSAGRDLALEVRHRPSTRRVPLVFVEGAAEKVERVRALLPDASFSTWQEVGPALERAIGQPPVDPVVPSSRMAGYARVPLAAKLGISEETVVSLVDAPDGFAAQLGRLPRGAVLREGLRGRSDLVVWFVRSERDVRRRLDRIAARAERSPVWIAWQKKASGVKSDLTQKVVRRMAEGAGLVDYKICSIDSTWSGLLFTKRRGGPKG